MAYLAKIASIQDDHFVDATTPLDLDLLENDDFEEFELFEDEDDQFLKILGNIEEEFGDVFDDGILIP